MKTERLVSIDFLRGLTVAGMILVNNPGSWDYVYSPLKHAQWNGCTPTDLVFPFFLFIVGLSINFSLSSAKNSVQNTSSIYLKIIKRSLILFFLGVFIAAFPFFQLDELRIPGVLQRISIVFLISAIIYFKCSKPVQIGLTVFFLVSYWILMAFVPIPGGTAPNLDPGTNLGAWLDRFLLDGHLWSHSKTWDPEGVLGTLPAIATCMLGVFAADFLKQQKPAAERIIYVFITGTALIVSGLIWDLVFPINKSLWTSSYVLYTAGIAMHALGISYWLIDVLQVRKFAKPFIFFGANAVTIYVGSELINKITNAVQVNEGMSLVGWIFNSLNVDAVGPYNASVLFAIFYVILFFFLAWYLYSKKIFIKV